MDTARAMPAPTHGDTNGSSRLVMATPAAPVERGSGFDPFELPSSPYRLSGATLAAFAVLAGAAAIALGAWAFVSSVRGDGSAQIVPLSGAAQAISLLSNPTTVRLPLTGSDGRTVLAVSSNGRGMLVLDGLGVAPVGRTYQAWVSTPRPKRSPPLSAAVFTGVETVVPLTARVHRGSLVGITVERPGGASVPTKEFRFTAQRPVARR
jgi:hypothetical protein